MKKLKNTITLWPDEIQGEVEEIEVDLSYLFSDDRSLSSVKIDYNGTELWKAYHYSKGIFWTSNPRDPKILNTAHEKPNKIRGNLDFSRGGKFNQGRPRGAANKMSVKQACDSLNTHPAIFLAAIMKGDVGILKQHRVKNPNEVTIAQKIKSAELLLNKISPNLKPVEIGSDGEPVLSKEAVDIEEQQKVQVYLPSKGATVEVELSEREAEQLSKIDDIDQYMESYEKQADDYEDE